MTAQQLRKGLLMLMLSLAACSGGEDRRDAATGPRADAASELDASSDGGSRADQAAPDSGVLSDAVVPCKTHYDCKQGAYCYKGSCAVDPNYKVYHCGQPGCPPGQTCVTKTGTRSRGGSSTAYPCKDACDCGPGYCCMAIAGITGKRCVRDLTDPWLPAPSGTTTIYGATCPADAPTYCCTDPSCYAGKAAYGSSTGFLCYDKTTKTSRAICGGKSCHATACQCNKGESCVDTTRTDSKVGAACDQLSGGSCVSNAVAEAVFSWKTTDILACCSPSCTKGQECDRGWRTDGAYAFKRVVGVCGGSCGNGSCDPKETITSCPGDCKVALTGTQVCHAVWKNPTLCGDGICGGSGVCDWTEAESCRTCPEDCGACRWEMVHGQGGFAALTKDINGIWGAAATNVYAVGKAGAILRYDGRRWTPMTSGSTKELLDVWGTSQSDVFAVGASGAILHYDGTRWSAMTSHTSVSLYGVWGSGASDVFAVGGSGKVAHYDGTSWSVTTLATRILRGVWASGPQDVFAVGDGGAIFHYDGSTWSAMTSGTAYGLYGVWGSSSTNVYAVSAIGIVLHYDGKAWSTVKSAAGYLLSITGTSASDVVAVGQNGSVLRYDGSSWSRVKRTAPPNLLDAWATAGHLFISGSEGALLHDSGSGLVDTGAVIKDLLVGMWAAPSGDVFAVGERGRVVHYDGTQWMSKSTGVTGYLRGVWGSSASDVYAAGQGGAMVHYDGTSWSTISSGSTGFLQAIWGSSASDIYVAGFSGTLLHSSGSGFSPIKISSSDYFTGLWGSSASDIYVVGAKDLLHYDGSKWSTSSVTLGKAHFLWGLSAKDLYLIDLYAGVSRYDSAKSSFVPLLTTTKRSYQGMWGTSSKDLTVIGVGTGAAAGSGFMDHYDGAKWSPERADLREPGSLKCRQLIAIHGGYAVGDNELILKRVP